MEFLSKDFCKLTGLKSDTLRYYVDMELLHPQVNDENHYKVYSEKDLIDLYYVRKCRNMEIPIRHVHELQAREALSDQLAYLDQYQRKLEQELERIQSRLKGCEKMRKDIIRIPMLTKEIIETYTGPDVAQLDLVGPGIVMDEKVSSVVAEWNKKALRLLTFIKIRQEDLLAKGVEAYPVIMGICFGIYPEVPIKEITPPAYIYPSSHSIGIMVRLKDPFVVTPKDLEPLFQYAREHDYRISSDLTSWLVTKSRENGVDYYYYALRVSVTENQ